MKLYEIESEIFKLLEERSELLDILSSLDTTDKDREPIADRLLEIDDAIRDLSITEDEKLNACCAHYTNLLADEACAYAELERLRSMKAKASRRVEAFKSYLQYCLPAGQKWENGVFGISWRKSQAVNIIKEEDIPSVYVKEKVVTEVDKKQILADLKCGATIPGVELDERSHIQIK